MNVMRMAQMAVVFMALALDSDPAAAARPLRVALYAEPVCTDDRCREAAARALAGDPALIVERVTSATIRTGDLTKFDALVIPGGTANGIAKSFGVEGGRRVTEFVKSGKGVVGICAGGYLVVEGWSPETRAIEVINATSWDDDHWARGEGFIAVKTADAKETSHTMWFENGPIFVPGKLPLTTYTPLIRYVTDLAAKGAPKGMMTGRDAVIAAPCGKGRVVAFGPHAELSPGLHHWLCSAVRWSAGEGSAEPSVQVTLERMRPGSASR